MVDIKSARKKFFPFLFFIFSFFLIFLSGTVVPLYAYGRESLCHILFSLYRKYITQEET